MKGSSQIADLVLWPQGRALLGALLAVSLCTQPVLADAVRQTTHRESRGPIAEAAAEAARHASPLVRAAQSGGGRPCGQKMLIGLGVGAGAGATMGAMVWKKVDEPGPMFAGLTALFGAIGLAVGFNACR